MQGRPLDGIKILELAAYISGPYAGSLLAALGAEVIKVEAPSGGEPFRRGQGVLSNYYAQYNAGKKSIAVDLKSAAGVAVIKELLPNVDVLIENMRPGTVAALGLGPEVCRQINPRLIYSSISGFGSGGPLVSRPAFDSIGQSFGGLYTVMNDADDVRLTGTCVADLITGVGATTGILAALVGRGKDPARAGVHVETSVLEAVSMLTIDAMTQAFEIDCDPVRETRHPQAQNFCLKTASGDSIVLHLSSSEKFWQALLSAMHREDLRDDPRFRRYAHRAIPENFRLLKQTLEQEFVLLPREEWERRLSEADIPFAPALTLREVAAHPQVQWLKLMDRQASGRMLVQPPWRFDGERVRRSDGVAYVGEHTREILGAIRSEHELESLVATKVIAAPAAGEKSG